MRRLLLMMLTSAAVTLAACGSDDPATDSASTPATTAASTPPTATTPPVGPGESPAADVEVTEGVCADVPAAEPKDSDVSESKGRLSTDKRSYVTLKTSCGSIKILLDAKDNPKTAASFASLAKKGFYDGLSFHRVVPGFVIQGGDPSGNGSGGPAWKVVEAPPGDQKYTDGVVAMAKTQEEAPGTSGSQFFIVSGADAQLPAQYAVAGTVVKGSKVVKAISDTGTPGVDGRPTKPVVIFEAKFSTE